MTDQFEQGPRSPRAELERGHAFAAEMDARDYKTEMPGSRSRRR